MQSLDLRDLRGPAIGVRSGGLAPWLLGAGLVAGAAALLNAHRARRAERANPPRGRFVSVDGVRLHYLEAGDRTAGSIVLLHGNGLLAEDWRISGLLERLAEHHHVIAFDRPGFGHSDRPRGKLWTAAAQARLLQRAMARLGLQRPVVVGHSWGALTALDMAVAHPRDVAGLVLLAGYYNPTPRKDVLMLSGPAIPVLGDLIRYTIAPVVSRLIEPALFRKLFAPGPVAGEFARRIPRALLRRPSQLRAAAADTAYMVPNAAASQAGRAGLDMPVTIMAGTRDRIASHEGQAAKLHRALSGSRLVLVEGAGHMLHYAAPDRVLGAILELAQRAGSSPAADPRQTTPRQLAAA